MKVSSGLHSWDHSVDLCSSKLISASHRIGMVHVGSISSQRVNAPSELLTRNQPVKVKVMSIAGGRMSLSMKDVDQATGADLS